MNLKKTTAALVCGSICMLSSIAQAHTFAVFANQKSSSWGTMAVTHPGWGHAIPMDDFVSGSSMDSYEVYDPTGAKHPISYDVKANEGRDGVEDLGVLKADAGDAFVRKLSFVKDAPKGVYTVAATMRQSFYTVYTDKNGKHRHSMKTIDQIDDASEIHYSSNYQNFAKTFVNVGPWSEPKPIGHLLEIIPLTDLSKVKPGDEVSFKVLLNGQALAPDREGRPKLTAEGEFYNMGKSYSIESSLSREGVATVPVPAAGRWLIKVSTKKPVGPDNRPDLVGKVKVAGYNATVTFVVHP